MNSQSEIDDVIAVQLAPLTVAALPASPAEGEEVEPASAPFWEMLGTTQAGHARSAVANAVVAKLAGSHAPEGVLAGDSGRLDGRGMVSCSSRHGALGQLPARRRVA